MCSYLLFTAIFYLHRVLPLSVGVTRDNTIIKTNVGTIRGVAADDGNYTMFMGIPFAKVNETNVFGEAIPYPYFEGVFDANDDSAICPQIEEFNFTTVGNLDCLHINVYVPERNSTNLLPVMVYIFGGRFEFGFAGRFLYGPKYIVRHDVILVTFNYRLGPYGFMCLDTPEVPGNQGFKDQVLALRWIKDNIRSFGGNPDRITLFGNSAGSISVDLHLMSDTENLYQNIILQSGAACAPDIFHNSNPKVPFRLAKLLGYTTENLHDALLFLSTVEPALLIKTAKNNSLSFSPCVEKNFFGVNSFVTNYPINYNMTKTKNAKVLLGVNSDEMLISVAEADPKDYFHLNRLLFRSCLAAAFRFDDKKLKILESIVRKFYLADNEISFTMRHELAKFEGDLNYVYPLFRSIRRYLDSYINEVYFYLFSHEGNRNFVKIKNKIVEPGVAHADEISYLFDMKFIPGNISRRDQLIIDRMTTMWTNFAKYDDPTPATTELLPLKWNPITKGSQYHYLEINTEMRTGTRHLNRQMTFWDLFYEAYGEYEIGKDYIPFTADKDDDDDDANEDDANKEIDDGIPSFAATTCSNTSLSFHLLLLLLFLNS